MTAENVCFDSDIGGHGGHGVHDRPRHGMHGMHAMHRPVAAALLVAVWGLAALAGAREGFASPLPAVPLLAQGGVGLLAPGLDQAAKPVKPAGNDAGAGTEPAPTSSQPPAARTSRLMKYGPSYVVMALLIGLGTFIICRPIPRHDDD